MNYIGLSAFVSRSNKSASAPEYATMTSVVPCPGSRLTVLESILMNRTAALGYCLNISIKNNKL